MKNEITSFKTEDGRFVIEQEKEIAKNKQEYFVVTIYKDGRSVFSTGRSAKMTNSDLYKTLESYIRNFG